jgi:hypothetical protein
MSYVINGLIDFLVSLLAFAIWTHFDLEGWYEQRRIARGRKLEEKRNG